MLRALHFALSLFVARQALYTGDLFESPDWVKNSIAQDFMMIIKPKVRGFICTTAHPEGCAAHVAQQQSYVQAQTKPTHQGPKRVLVIGASTGYGLASRIVSAFAYGADTLGVMFEKPGTETRTGSAGYYNTQAFEAAAKAAGRYAQTLNMDAFSHDAKQAVIAAIRKDLGQVDLVVYSLASPRRQDPNSDQIWNSVLKPIGEPVSRKTLNTDSGEVSEVTLEPANEDEIHQTVKVMGGEDWELWMAALDEAGVLAQGVKTTAYTYIGKALTWPIYGHATIGKAKEDLDRAAQNIDQALAQRYGGEARVSVLKALVTQAAAAIPVMPLYISLLYRVMKAQGTHEGAIEHVYRLFTTALYGIRPTELVDDQGRLRIDLWELDDAVQNEVERLWHEVNTDNVSQIADVQGYREDFFTLFGFGLPGVDYEADTDPRGITSVD